MAYLQKNGNSLDASCKISQEMFGGKYYSYLDLWNYYIVYDKLDISEIHEQRGVQQYKIYEIDDFDEKTVDILLEFAYEYTINLI